MAAPNQLDFFMADFKEIESVTDELRKSFLENLNKEKSIKRFSKKQKKIIRHILSYCKKQKDEKELAKECIKKFFPKKPKPKTK